MGHKIASINTYKAVNTPIGAKHAAPIAIFEMITENSPLETLPKPIFNDALLENPLIFPAIPPENTFPTMDNGTAINNESQTSPNS